MNEDQAKSVLKSVSRADAVKIALADMREEIAEELKATEEELFHAEETFMAHARNRALIRHAEMIANISKSTGIDTESVFAVAHYDFNTEPDKVRVILTDGSAYDHKVRVAVDIERPDLEHVRALRQRVLRLREMQDPDAEEARANVLKAALNATPRGQQILSLLKELRSECKS